MERTQVISELRQKYPLDDLLKMAGLSRSTFYCHLKRLNRPDKHAEIRVQIEAIFVKNKGRYGYRRVHVELRKAGYGINHKTTQSLMRDMNLQEKQRKNKYRSYKGTVGKIADNILNRNFVSDKPFEKLVTDVTEFAVCNQKVYLSPVLDLFNTEILSYSISNSPNFAQTKTMMNELFKVLPKDATPEVP